MPKLRACIPLLLALAAALLTAASYGVVNSQSANGKYDTDGDGLIEIEYLEQLDAIRYDLDGDGRSDDGRYAAAFPTMDAEQVCESECSGYELARLLDFGDSASYASGSVNTKWTSGDGWLPIGNFDSHAFNAIFDGNGYAISNLYINRTTQFNNPVAVGLFSYFGGGRENEIRDVGLVNVDVTGFEHVGGLAGANSGTIRDSYSTGNVSGESGVGGLVGENGGVISDSYASGEVYGIRRVGGFVGSGSNVSGSFASGDVSGESEIGGLAGIAGTNISGCYATGNVSGTEYVGGLAGSAIDIDTSYATGNVLGKTYVGGLTGSADTITVSYATGNVSGEYQIGGLTGSVGGGPDRLDGTIINSYSIGWVTGGEGSVGGLAGSSNDNATVIASYWNTQTSGQPTSAAGEGKTTAELQSPTGYTGIYANWHIDLDNADQDFDQSTGRDDYWDFGTSSQYPAVKADLDGDGVATWHEVSGQGRPLPTPTPSPQPIATLTPTATAIPTPTYTPTPVPTATPTPTLTPVPTATPIPTPTYTPTPMPTATPEPSPTPTLTPMPTATTEPTVTLTPTPLPTDTPAPVAAATQVQPTETSPPPVQVVTVVVTATPAPTPEATPVPASESSGGACGLPIGDAPMSGSAGSLLLLLAPLGMIWGLKWRGRQKRDY